MHISPRPAGEPGFIRTADGVNLFCRDWGDGAPIVFLAGWCQPSDSWCYQMAPLCEAGFRCVAFDRRGHGRSTDPGRGYDYDTLADDLAAVMDGLDLRGAVLVGHSMGAGEIVRYLTRHGAARVARIVLVGPATPMLRRADDNPGGIDDAVFEAFRREKLMRDYPQWIEDNLAAYVAEDTPARMREWIRGMALQPSLHALLECNRTITAADLREELRRITVPALVIQGDRDASFPVELTGHPTAALLPDARLAVYEGAPHGIPITHMDRLNADLLEFAHGRS